MNIYREKNVSVFKEVLKNEFFKSSPIAALKEHLRLTSEAMEEK